MIFWQAGKQGMERLTFHETAVQAKKNGGAGCLPVKSMSFPQQYHHPPQNYDHLSPLR
ncbi:hypothetical protein GKC49_00560 [Pantoea agglomerans]|uniref:Uncharacterized protein n=1 Tax=Enterobacter agglomerans TaxID=549 RepID=A0A7X2MIC7_ENTAG|nr:hypothetical protein [Pantoea agglomerans]